jgi:hypothetical protein
MNLVRLVQSEGSAHRTRQLWNHGCSDASFWLGVSLRGLGRREWLTSRDQPEFASRDASLSFTGEGMGPTLLKQY